MCSACTGDYENPDLVAEEEDDFYHSLVCAKIATRIDCSRDPLDAILEDEFVRHTFNLKPRQLLWMTQSRSSRFSQWRR
jgi:hypothetical protein